MSEDSGYVYTLERRLLKPFETMYSRNILRCAAVDVPHVFFYAMDPVTYLRMLGNQNYHDGEYLSRKIEDLKHITGILEHIADPEAITPVLIARQEHSSSIVKLQKMRGTLDILPVQHSAGQCCEAALIAINERVLEHSDSTGADYYVIALEGGDEYKFYDAGRVVQQRKQQLIITMLSMLEKTRRENI